ncbi:hypothetical protein [Micromonospora rosaria]|nr:hypothetical protein [Micromonospora rosaria]
MSSEPEPGIAPDETRDRNWVGDPILMTVDGQDFRVRAYRAPSGAWGYDFDWLSGPHEYGFGSSGAGMSRAEMEQAIRSFLAEIDPATGYLAE